MELKFLLDSVNSAVDDVPNISIVFKIEVLSYQTIEEEYELLKSFCNDAVVFELNDEIVNKTIDLRIQHKLKTPDAIIAATALIYNMILLTRNIDDFGKVEGLTIINPFDL